MSKFLVICPRAPQDWDGLLRDAQLVGEILAPDNVDPRPPEMSLDQGIVRAVYNSTGVSHQENHCLLVGTHITDPQEWTVTGGPPPDGTFALVRHSPDRLELVTDAVGSRTIWYYHDPTVFIAATSQRAIIALLRSFEFNSAVIPWVLSTGALGPTASWDRRVRRVPPRGIVRLNRRSWVAEEYSEEPNFTPLKVSDREHENLLLDALQESVRAMNLDWSDWVLPLSGGGDSRALLSLLHQSGAVEAGLRTVTWGLLESRTRPGNDAYIAAQVAKHFQIPHTYLPTDVTEEPADTVLDRFFRAGEGRVAHFAGYADGMRVWAELFRSGAVGTIRGDQPFGLNAVSNPLDVRLKSRLVLFSDVANLRRFDDLGWPRQNLPESLMRRDGESLASWRDRLRLVYELPTILAGLADVKLNFGEQITPLLTRRIVDQVTRMPDHLRDDKAAFKRISSAIGPEIPFATSGANAEGIHIFRRPAFKRVLIDSLTASETANIIPVEYLAAVIAGLRSSPRTDVPVRQLRRVIRGTLPPRVRAHIRKNIALPSIDWHTQAFRIHMIARMRWILNSDSDYLAVRDRRRL